jgi:pyruvate dehydrogenase E2 component (dihydrolipoamide acetyltransferase)
MTDTGNPAISALVPVRMPYLGESIVEATVDRWLKDIGDFLEADQPLLEVFTDKVDVQILAPVSGYLRNIAVNADETVLVGSVLGEIEVKSRAREQAIPQKGQIHFEPRSFYLLTPKWVANVINPTLSRWHKTEGDNLAIGDPILDINTEYADIRVRCPVSGTLRSILIVEDDSIAPGDALALIEIDIHHTPE